MTDSTRRALLTGTTVLGVAAFATVPPTHGSNLLEDGGDQLDRDMGFVMGAGMTEDEAKCWKAAADCAGAFFALPEMHPMDKTEVATAIHVIQNKLLSRPTYRKYLENAKAAGGK